MEACRFINSFVLKKYVRPRNTFLLRITFAFNFNSEPIKVMKTFLGGSTTARRTSGYPALFDRGLSQQCKKYLFLPQKFRNRLTELILFGIINTRPSGKTNDLNANASILSF